MAMPLSTPPAHPHRRNRAVLGMAAELWSILEDTSGEPGRAQALELAQQIVEILGKPYRDKAEAESELIDERMEARA